jgi:uncharacterized membrane protein
MSDTSAVDTVKHIRHIAAVAVTVAAAASFLKVWGMLMDLLGFLAWEFVFVAAVAAVAAALVSTLLQS